MGEPVKQRHMQVSRSWQDTSYWARLVFSQGFRAMETRNAGQLKEFDLQPMCSVSVASVTFRSIAALDGFRSIAFAAWLSVLQVMVHSTVDHAGEY